MRARDLLGREDRQLAVVCPFGPVRRVFELSGLSELFALFASREAAAAALVPARLTELDRQACKSHRLGTVHRTRETAME